MTIKIEATGRDWSVESFMRTLLRIRLRRVLCHKGRDQVFVWGNPTRLARYTVKIEPNREDYVPGSVR